MNFFYYFLSRKFATTCINWSYSTVLNYLSLEIWLTISYRGADTFLARPGRKQATATEDFDVHHHHHHHHHVPEGLGVFPAP
jgi:hypothetical protein